MLDAADQRRDRHRHRVLGGKVTASDNETITVVLAEVLVKPAELPRTGAPLGTEARLGLLLLQAGLVLEPFGLRRRRLHPQAS